MLRQDKSSGYSPFYKIQKAVLKIALIIIIGGLEVSKTCIT